MTLTPSKIARYMASAVWPDVQRQWMLEKGIYWFSSAGHGGCVAVHGIADIPESAWELARKHGLTAYVSAPHGRMYDSKRYNVDAQTPNVTEVWIGEEDCEWSTIFIAHRDPARLIGKADSKGFRFEEVEYARRCCANWYPEFLADHNELLAA